jgi:dTDP-4-dehydrorhamnose reductase
VRIALLGAGGRLGAVLRTELAAAGYEVMALRRADLDVCSRDEVNATIARLQPDVIVNCTAYNAVDRAESDAAGAFALNACAPALLAEAGKRVGALLVHYSTDFVFDGTALQPYTEEAATNPLSVYGASKLAGENEIRKLQSHYILRVSSLFGGTGVHGHRATIDAISNKLLTGGGVRVFVDRTVSPSYVPDVVRATRFLLENEAPFGTYHCVSSGMTTWYGLAVYIADRLGLPATIVPVSVANVALTARRPQFCGMSNEKLLTLGMDAADWRVAVSHHLATQGLQSVAFDYAS